MPFDGVVTKCIVEELSDILPGGRIEKIFQPESDEIIMHVRSNGQNYKLLLSASANYPRIHITEIMKENPSYPPMFCMLLRKHLLGGKFVSVDFHDYERIVTLQIESVSELGDITVKKLVIEIMGRHSNIILINEQGKIIDAIKHVDSEISSIREVMPARMYVLPPSQDKTSPELLDVEVFIEESLQNSVTGVEKQLLNKIKGFSPLLCREICFRAGIDGRMPVSQLNPAQLQTLLTVLKNIINDIRLRNFEPCIIMDPSNPSSPVDFHCLKMTQFSNTMVYASINKAADVYYNEKDRNERLKQKKSDIYRVLANSIERCNKKISLQEEKLREVADRDKLKLYGELIIANVYCIPKGSKKATVFNYYSENGDMVEIPLDENLTPQQNAQMYFKKYAKAKSAYVNTMRQLEESLKELEYLESVQHLLDNCSTLQEIDEVRQELAYEGYLSIKSKPSVKNQDKISAPLHFRSSDGFDILVGKNNRQNDMLTMKQASSNDIWLHTHNIPGSHVIIRNNVRVIPDSTLLEAAKLAAWYSKARFSSNVPVDYTYVKNVKKPPGSKPGMVIYDKFHTIVVTPDEGTVKRLSTDNQSKGIDNKQ